MNRFKWILTPHTIGVAVIAVLAALAALMGMRRGEQEIGFPQYTEVATILDEFPALAPVVGELASDQKIARDEFERLSVLFQELKMAQIRRKIGSMNSPDAVTDAKAVPPNLATATQ